MVLKVEVQGKLGQEIRAMSSTLQLLKVTLKNAKETVLTKIKTKIK